MTKAKSPIELSVIVTAHHEGILAHKTILSVLRALEAFDAKGISYEIIVHIDNGDEATKNYYSRYEDDERFVIFENSFGNPADSRNYGVKKSRGKYATFLDGDDLVSRNWLIDGYDMLVKSKEPTVLRPQYHFHFGESEELNHVWIMEGSFSKEEDALILSFYNRWTLPLIAPTDLLRAYPFKPALNGFAYEDWLFNADIRAADIPVAIVPGAVLFYKRRRGSVTSEHAGGILEYSDLFDIDYVKSLKVQVPVAKKDSKIILWTRTAKKIIIHTGKSLRVSTRVRRLTDPALQRVLYKKRSAQLPVEFIDAWKDINSIENQLYPTKSAVRSVNFHPLSFNQHDVRFGLIYKQLADQVTKKPDYLFLPPDLGVGGTEKVIFNYIRAITRAHPDWHIAVIGRLHKSHAHLAPPNVDFIDFEGATSGLTRYEKDIIWSRLLIQLQVKRLHIINNPIWYQWLAEHKKLLGHEGYVVNASMFMREYTEEQDHVRSFADPLLSDIYPIVNKVFTDNQNIIDEMLVNNAFDKERLIVHYQPESLPITPPRTISSNKPLRVLWAGRLAQQKRPDILKKIGQQLNGREFHIDVYGSTTHHNGSFFKGVSTITYKGPFSGIRSIPTSEYDVFIYTSSVDGVPNILLEISALGLPIIASDDGGVREFIHHNETGILVDIEDIDGYIKALQYIKAHPQHAKDMVLSAQKLLQSQHSVEKFEACVKKDIV